MRVVVRKTGFVLLVAVGVALLQLPTPAFATTVTIEGPLGTTVTTPPLQLGAPGQTGSLDGTSVGVAGVGVSAQGAAANPSPAAPADQGPAQQTPSPQTPAAGDPPSTPAAVSQPGSAPTDDAKAAQPVSRGGAKARSPNDGASVTSGSRRSESGGSISTGEQDGTAAQAGESGGESATRRPSRPSVAERIVDRVPAVYRFGLLAVAGLACGFALATAHERRRARRAESEALVDTLTGLANRRAFDRRLAEEWKRSERYGRPLGLVMLDLDGFKQVNDTRGHKEGDRVLREAASLIADRLRTIDMAARLGGDEFAALCPETAGEGLDALTHSLERCLEGLPVGASIGFAEREPTDENPLDLLARADEAMYRQKRRHDAAAVDRGLIRPRRLGLRT